jgi:hypothetical protein
VNSSTISRASAALLALGGIALLFASDSIIPRVAPGVSADAAWLGQLIGAGWLALAALNWLGRNTILGGIYGRPVVVANAALYFITGTTLVKVVMRGDAAPTILVATIVALAFAAVYAWLLFRGPLEPRGVS